jgi:uncharacterized protein YndB with AHSA1/START domain
MENHLSITRIIKHPRNVVFNAWITRKELEKWFAPRGCTIVFSKLQLRSGGKFLEIDYPKRIQYRIRLADENGNPVSSQEIFKDKDWPEETLVTVTFHENDNCTEINIHQTVIETLARKTGAYNGWIDMLDILEESITLNELNVKD